MIAPEFGPPKFDDIKLRRVSIQSRRFGRKIEVGKSGALSSHGRTNRKRLQNWVLVFSMSSFALFIFLPPFSYQKTSAADLGLRRRKPDYGLRISSLDFHCRSDRVHWQVWTTDQTGVPAECANQSMHSSSLIVAIDKLLPVPTITPRLTPNRWPANGVIVDVRAINQRLTQRPLLIHFHS